MYQYIKVGKHVIFFSKLIIFQLLWREKGIEVCMRIFHTILFSFCQMYLIFGMIYTHVQ